MGVALTKLIVVASACILSSRDAVLLFFFSSESIDQSDNHQVKRSFTTCVYECIRDNFDPPLPNEIQHVSIKNFASLFKYTASLV